MMKEVKSERVEQSGGAQRSEMSQGVTFDNESIAVEAESWSEMIKLKTIEKFTSFHSTCRYCLEKIRSISSDKGLAIL